MRIVKKRNKDCSKTIWHKVADGDLPKENSEVYCCRKYRDTLFFYHVGYYFTDAGEETPHFYYFDREEGWIRQDDIIAWMELPTYKEEEE